MAAEKDGNDNTHNRRGTVSSMVISHKESSAAGCAVQQPVIFNPDFFVEKLRHEKPEAFLEIVLRNITRLVDLPGTEFAQLLGEESPKTPSGGNGGFFRSFNFLKRKDRSIVFGTPLRESSIAKICRLIEYLSKNLHVEGLFRVPGNSVRQQALRELLSSGSDVDLESAEFHPNDAATLLKSFLGELPEPLLTHRHFHVHLKIADMTLFDEQGNKTTIPNKERQIEALQLLFLMLPQTNRSLLKLLLNLLYHTAKNQDKNKMSAHNLAMMFAPHVLWPKHMTASDVKENMKKLNNSMAFLIKHSQKLFKAPVYLREEARWEFTGTKVLQTKDDLELAAVCSSPTRWSALPLKRTANIGPNYQEQCQSPAQQYTEEALKELFRHVHHNMPDSAKKKKLVRQLVKQTNSGTPTSEDHKALLVSSKKHPRSRSFGGLIKRRARGEQTTGDRRLLPEALSRAERKAGKENVVMPPFLKENAGMVVENPALTLYKDQNLNLCKDSPPGSRTCFSPAQGVAL